MCSLAEVCTYVGRRMAAVSVRLQSPRRGAGFPKLCRWTRIRRGLRAARRVSSACRFGRPRRSLALPKPDLMKPQKCWEPNRAVLRQWSRSELYTSRGGGPVIAAQVRTQSPLPNAAAAAKYDQSAKRQKSAHRRVRSCQRQTGEGTAAAKRTARSQPHRSHGPPAPGRLLHLDAGQVRPESD